MLRFVSPMTAWGEFSVLPRGRKPAGSLVILSPWLFQTSRKFVEEGALRVALELAGAILALGRAFDLAAESMGDELHAIADPENGNAKVVDFTIHLRSLGRVNTRRTAREDDAGRFELRDSRGFCVVGNDLGVNLALPHAAGYDLSILGTEIEDEYFITGWKWRHGVALSVVWAEVIRHGSIGNNLPTPLDSLLKLCPDILSRLLGNRATSQKKQNL